MKDFDTFQKMPKNVGDLGKLIVAKGFEKVAQSPINRPIWSHWLSLTEFRLSLLPLLFLKRGLARSKRSDPSPRKMWLLDSKNICINLKQIY